MNKVKYKHPLEIITFGIIPIVNYKNCLVEKLKDGYKIFGQKVSKPEQVDEIINKASQSLRNSLVNEL